MSVTLETLKKKALQIVESVSNNPEGRYQLRVEFYERYGLPVEMLAAGFGNSELAFLKWEIDRGVLNPLTGSKPGSPWWRTVNSYFLYQSTLAGLIQQSGESFQDLEVPVQMWLKYFTNRNPSSWYKAHNSTIIKGYLEANNEAFKEIPDEQYFMNIVLYRLLFAQSMVEGVSFGILGRILANPRGPAVSIITDIDAFYPKHYPMTKQEMRDVMHKAHDLEGIIDDFFDKVLILPQLHKLYENAADWNQSPEVLQFIRKNKPIYPIKQEGLLGISHFEDELKELDVEKELTKKEKR